MPQARLLRRAPVRPSAKDLSTPRLLGFCLAGALTPAIAASLTEAETLFRTGRYEECANLASKAIEEDAWGEHWSRLLIEAELRSRQVQGRAHHSRRGEKRFPGSGTLHLLGRDVYPCELGRTDDATARRI